MKKLIIPLIWIVFISINDFKLLYQSSMLILVVLGVYYFFQTKNKRLISIEKNLLFAFALYSFSFLIYIFNDEAFSYRDIDHGSRFLLLIPLYFVFKKLNNFKFLKSLIFVSTFLTSLFVLYNFFVLKIDRGYNYSCISGAQISLIFGVFSLFAATKISFYKERIFFLIPSILAFISVILSQTRGVILILPIIIIFTLYLRYKEFNFKIIFSICFIFLSFILVSVQILPELSIRYDQTRKNVGVLLESIQKDQFDGNTSITIRYNFLKYGYLAFLESPLLGNGRKGFRDSMIKTGFNEKFTRQTTHSHNQFISDLVMRGMFGFLSTLMFMSYLIYIFIKLRRMGEYEFTSYGLILIFSYIMFFLTDSPFIGSMHSTLFFIFCFLLFFRASFNEIEKKE